MLGPGGAPVHRAEETIGIRRNPTPRAEKLKYMYLHIRIRGIQ